MSAEVFTDVLARIASPQAMTQLAHRLRNAIARSSDLEGAKTERLDFGGTVYGRSLDMRRQLRRPTWPDARSGAGAISKAQ